MKKTLTFEKDLMFNTMIGEISDISINNDLEFTSKNTIEGKFYITGKYKMHEASTLLEDFSFEIPTDISTTSDYEIDSVKISISDFTYQVVDEKILRCNISLLIDGRELVLIDSRECDSDVVDEDDKEIPIKEEKVIEEDNDNNKEKYTTYSVYIMRENDSIDKIMNLYKVSKDELEQYNDLSNLELNSKVIIPTTNNEES